MESLIRRYQRDGDRRAREVAIRMSMPFVRRLALRYCYGREPLEDLVQVAYVGLVKAVDRFDPSRGRSFRGFAVPTILGELRHHDRDTTWALHVPRGLQDASVAVKGARQRISQTTGQTPTIEQLAVDTGLTVELVAEALRLSKINHTVPLKTPDDESLSLDARLGGEDRGFDVAEHRVMLGDAIRNLPEHEQRVVALRFVYDLTQSEIAGCFEVSQMQIPRVLRHAVDTLLQGLRPNAREDGQPLAGCERSEPATEAGRGLARAGERQPTVRDLHRGIQPPTRRFDLRTSGTHGGTSTSWPAHHRYRVRSVVRPPSVDEGRG